MNNTGFDYDDALLAWEKAMLRQRIKYSDTPPGIRDSGTVSALQAALAKKSEAAGSSALPSLLGSTVILPEPFAGRKQELERIAHIFENGTGPAIICGIGGIGKTALAKVYVLKNKDCYSRILFLTFEGSLERLISNDSSIRIKDMEYRADIYKTRRRYANAKLKVLKHILAAEKVLIIIDDWNHPEGKLQEEFLSLPCDIIVTTRLAPERWNSGSAFELKELTTKKEWEAFYQLYTLPLDDAADKKRKQLFNARRHEVHGHTLRMKLFAAEMNAGLSPPEKISQKPSGDFTVPERKASASFGKDGLLDRFTLKKQELSALAMLSVMPVEGISEARFLKISGVSQRTLTTLKSQLLIQTDRHAAGAGEAVISLHPVIAEEVRQKYRPSSVVCRSLMKGLAGEVQLTWMNGQKDSAVWEPVIYSVLKSFNPPPARFAREYEILITWLWLQEYYEDAKRFMKKLLRAVHSMYGDAHVLTGAMQLRMAAVCFNSRAMEEADFWYERAYDTLKGLPAADPIRTGYLSHAASKLSRVCRSRKDFAHAMELIDEAISLFHQCIGDLKKLEDVTALPFHTYLTLSYYLLDKGKIFLRTGRIEDAEKMYCLAEDALKGDDEAMHLARNTFGSTEYEKFRLGLYEARGQWICAAGQARRMLDYALSMRSPEHSYVLDVREWLADALAKCEMLEESTREYIQVLTLLKKYHPLMKKRIRKIEQKLQNSGSKLHAADE